MQPYRLLFDFVYNGTFKYAIFEFGRPIILSWSSSVGGIGVVRLIQDLVTTVFKVALLNGFGFRG